MKKKLLYSAALLAALTVGVTACGRKEANVTTEEQTVQTEEAAAQTEETAEEPEVSPEEPRDLEETDENIREQGMLMLQNLELEEYLDESINLIATEEWLSVMLDGAIEGSRNYYVKRNDENILTIQVGYDEEGERYARVCYLGGQVRVLQRRQNAVQLLTTQLQDGRYDGAYEVWTCDGDTGSIYQENGSFEQGVPTGEYTLKVHEGEVQSEVFSLWSSREGMKYTTYTGAYEEQEELSVSEWFWWEHETEGLVKQEEKTASQKPVKKPAAETTAQENTESDAGQQENQPAAEQQTQPAAQPSQPSVEQESQQPAEEVQQPSEDNGENDVDVEWTPDML